MQKMQLESFDDDAPDVAHTPAGFEQGFAEGYAEGLAAAKSEQANLQQELVQSIADLDFKYEEVRGEITRALGPLFAELSQKLFPHLVASGFAGQIADILTQAALPDPDRNFTLHVHPDQQAAVTAALADTALRVAIAADAEVSPHAAWVRYAEDAIYVDLDQLLAEIQQIMSTVDFIETRTEAHG